MGGLLELLQQPTVAAGAAALVLVGFAIAFFSFVRSGRSRRARDEALRRERSLRKQFDAILSSARDGVIIVAQTGEIAMLTDAGRADARRRPGDGHWRAAGPIAFQWRRRAHASRHGPRGIRAGPGRRATANRWRARQTRAGRLAVGAGVVARGAPMPSTASPPPSRPSWIPPVFKRRPRRYTAPTPSSGARWRTRLSAWRWWTSSGVSWRSTGPSQN